jgi:hypothetical protein
MRAVLPVMGAHARGPAAALQPPLPVRRGGRVHVRDPASRRDRPLAACDAAGLCLSRQGVWTLHQPRLPLCRTPRGTSCKHIGTRTHTHAERHTDTQTSLVVPVVVSACLTGRLRQRGAGPMGICMRRRLCGSRPGWSRRTVTRCGGRHSHLPCSSTYGTASPTASPPLSAPAS